MGMLDLLEGLQNTIEEVKKSLSTSPIFKEGEWIVYRGRTFYIREVDKEQGYIVGDQDCLPFSWEPEIRKWRIEDAQEGDLIAKNTRGRGYWIGIFRRIVDGNTIHCYAFTHHAKPDATPGLQSPFLAYDLHPATKEETDLFFLKLKEGGYSWDPEEKELKKVEDRNYPIIEKADYEKGILELSNLGLTEYNCLMSIITSHGGKHRKDINTSSECPNI